mmetsp:Transcript_21251/g.21382  ORF Transcript_21251/g.21382 Transcript_21251/m.21382 type:complete len:126 (-) Transcript_21251:118-495(-)
MSILCSYSNYNGYISSHRIEWTGQDQGTCGLEKYAHKLPLLEYCFLVDCIGENEVSNAALLATVVYLWTLSPSLSVIIAWTKCINTQEYINHFLLSLSTVGSATYFHIDPTRDPRFEVLCIKQNG